MALQIIVSNSIGVGVRVNLLAVDDLFVAEGVTVGSTDTSTTIEGTGSYHHIDVQGTVVCEQQAIDIGTIASFGQTLLIGENAYVAATLAPTNIFAGATVSVGGDASIIDNRGTIRGFSAALAIYGDGPSSDDIRIFNSGLIEATSFGITASGQCPVTFVNTGEIRTYHPNGEAYRSSGALMDHVTNNGLMVGKIQLGQGDDLYDGRAGRVTGEVDGSVGIDTLFGGALGETFKGGADNDILNGGGGNDILDGGTGADSMIGGAGNDIFMVDDLGDVVNESGGSGIDLVQSTRSFNLASPAKSIGAVENLTLVNVATALSGGGNAYNNVISGNNFANILDGLGGNDTLIGGANNDKLNGGLGNDTLIGGANKDIFIFNSLPNSTTNRDAIGDFSHADDTMQLENAIFSKLGAAGGLNPAFLRVGAAAADANDYIVYNKATGALFYDDNGSGAGHAVMFAVLSTRPVIAANDFLII
jgi:Ca2+-binding RTX toxin-like protein